MHPSRAYPSEHQLLDALAQTGGRLQLTAALLGETRLRVYRLLTYMHLWPTVERIRNDVLLTAIDHDAARAATTASALAPDGQPGAPTPRRRRPPWWSLRRTR